MQFCIGIYLVFENAELIPSWLLDLGETKHLINIFILSKSFWFRHAVFSCKTLLKEWLKMWSQPFWSFYGVEFQITNLKFSDWSKGLFVIYWCWVKTIFGPIGKIGNSEFVRLLGEQLIRVMLKFIYSEKATKFCEIFTLLLTVCTVV